MEIDTKKHKTPRKRIKREKREEGTKEKKE